MCVTQMFATAPSLFIENTSVMESNVDKIPADRTVMGVLFLFWLERLSELLPIWTVIFLLMKMPLNLP